MKPSNLRKATCFVVYAALSMGCGSSNQAPVSGSGGFNAGGSAAASSMAGGAAGSSAGGVGNGAANARGGASATSGGVTLSTLAGAATGGQSTGTNAGGASGTIASAGAAAATAGSAGTSSLTFAHPGCLSTQADLDRMKTKVLAGAQPWQGSWALLVANAHAQLTYSPNPQATICAGSCTTSENYMSLANDAAAAYQLALRYHVSGDTGYADKAGQILDAWAAKLTAFTGDSNAGLRAALYGYQLACAGELLRNYAKWDPTNLQRLLTDVFYPIQSDFLKRHNGACEGNYWANWDLANMAALLAIGVFSDRRDIFDEGIDYFYHGIGEGAIEHVVHYVHPDGSGQWQESGRDQGHNTLGPMLMGVICEIAWNQGIDLYGYAGNRFLAGSEYVTAYNLGNEVPYVTYIYTSGSGTSCKYSVQSVISASSRGSMRAGYDLIYNHYVNRTGSAAPFTKLYAEGVRPEGGGGDYGSTSGGFDSLGFTTLTHSLDPIALGTVPSALHAFSKGHTITLSWTGSAYAIGYRVKRATKSSGPYTTVATIDTPRTNFADADLAPGVPYYYVVSAVTALGNTADSQELTAAADGQLVGTVIGTSGSFGSTGATRELVFDGSLANFFDGPDSVSWAGLDLGAGVSAVVTAVRYTPRKNFGSRMVGGRFQGSSTPDFSSDVTELFTITEAPPNAVLTTKAVTSTVAFRYLRYVSPANGFGNVAEVQFIGD